MTNRTGDFTGAALVAAIIGFLAFGFGGAEAGHTFETGTCWKPGTPRLCRATWIQDQWLTVRLIDQFSDQRPAWRYPFEGAMWAWNRADGPQSLHYVPQMNDTWIFLRDQASAPGFAHTMNCNTSGICFMSGSAIIIWYSNVDLDRGEFPLYEDQQQWVFAHEYGHALGLAHHSNSSTALMYNYLTNPPHLGPEPVDIGVWDCPSSATTLWGIRCIYRWPY